MHKKYVLHALQILMQIVLQLSESVEAYIVYELPQNKIILTVSTVTVLKYNACSNYIYLFDIPVY